MTDHSSYFAYGARVEPPPEAVPFWNLNDVRPQGGEVAVMSAGAYDADDYYLVVSDTWEELKPGDAKIITPYSATDETQMAWDALIVAAAEELKIRLLGQPGYIFVADES